MAGSDVDGSRATTMWCFEHTNAAVDMPCCCDCAEVDIICDRCCKCRGLDVTEVDRCFSAMADRCRFPSCFGRGAIQVRLDLASPLVMIPLGILLASLNSIMTYMVLAAFAFSLSLYYRVWKRRSVRTRTKFFYMWSLVSCLVIYYIFEVVVAVHREVLFWENFVLSSMFAALMYCMHLCRRNPGTVRKLPQPVDDSRRGYPEPGVGNLANGRTHTWDNIPGNNGGGIKSEEESNGYGHQGPAHVQHRDFCEVPLGLGSSASSPSSTWCQLCQMERPPRAAHCPVCAVCVRSRDHHCVWVDNCIGENNHRAFFIGLALFLLSGCYGSHLMLTTVCTPVMYYDWFLFPADCRFVYNDILSAIGYVCAVYTLLGVAGMSSIFVYQAILISQNITSQELRKAGSQGRVRCGVWVKNNAVSVGLWSNWKHFLTGRFRWHSSHSENA